MDLREVAKPERERERERGNDGRVEISSGEENVEGGARAKRKKAILSGPRARERARGQ